jgi:predicted ATPase
VELAKRGFAHAPEVARQIIQEQVRMGGLALPWADRAAYTALMLERSIESYAAQLHATKPTFSDRGIPDTLAYARIIGLAETEPIERACRRYRYAPLVLLAPPWREIYVTDSERKQDFAEGERTYDHLADVYRQCGYEVLEIPRASPAERAQFVVERLHLAG